MNSQYYVHKYRASKIKINANKFEAIIDSKRVETSEDCNHKFRNLRLKDKGVKYL
jgi:hypothetical protein